MGKKLLTLLVLTFFLPALCLSAELSRTMPIQNHELIRGDESMPAVEYYPLSPGFTTDSPGLEIGTTYYDYQTNGSSGNRMVICNDNSKYFCWMKLLGWPYPPAPRHIYHNWIDAAGNLNPNGFTGQVSANTPSGYTNMDAIYGNRGAITYHIYNVSPYNILSVDLDPPGLGFFDHYDPPDELFPQTPNNPGRLYWPYITVDRSNRIHLAASEDSDVLGWFQRLGYTRSSDGGQSWSAVQLVDTVIVISSVLDASPVSDRVVLAYSRTQDTSTQWYNDIYYVVSENGTVWDFRYGRNNITNYLSDTDSLWAYTDLDVIFDYDDYIHITWNAQHVTDEGIYYRTYLFHWSEETDQITEILHHPDSLWINMSGVWNRPICKMNMGVSQAGGVYVTYTRFDTSDVSAGGYGNGDICLNYSLDGGAIWSNQINLTDSHTPGCFPGQCDSDHWSSLADVVNDSIHLFYVNDKDAGGIPQTEGSATENPVKYLGYAVPTGIDDSLELPSTFVLNQNYPNPFNAETTIPFELNEASSVTLDIYDLTGARVASLVNEYQTAGNHRVVWDASGFASGVYYYKLEANSESYSRRMILIK
jgi:hypothetical protein